MSKQVLLHLLTSSAAAFGYCMDAKVQPCSSYDRGTWSNAELPYSVGTRAVLRTC